MDVDSDSSSSSSSDSNDEELEKYKQDEMKKKIDALENKILINPSDYDAHVELIEVLRCADDLDQLRAARKRLNDKYPLSANLWLDWIKDEIAIVTTDEEKDNIIKLCEKAVKDYLSIDLWLEYVQFSIGCMSDTTGTDIIRELMERALTAGGLHVPNGNVLFEVYNEFEKLILMSLKQGTDEKAINDQKRRINNLYRRQLSVPLFDMENTYAEYQQWLTAENLEKEKSTVDAYNKAFSKLQQIQVFEDRLLSKEAKDRLESYEEYIRWEKNPKEGGNKPSRIICLYERAIADIPLTQTLWADYIDYIVVTIKEADFILATCKRSVDNCTWSSDLWIIYLTQAEANNQSHEEITAIMEKALSSWFSSPAEYRSLYLSYIFYLRRRLNNTDAETKLKRIEDIRSMLEQGQKFLLESYGYSGDPNCELLLWWTDFEAIITGDMERVRNMWNEILNAGLNQYSSYWMKYINIEIQFGDQKHVRKIFARALMTNTDLPETIGTEWIRYETLYGDLDTLLNCKEKYKTKMKQVQETHEKDPKTENKIGTKEKEAKKRKWDEKEPTKTHNEKSNGNFKVPYAKNDNKQESESSPVKKFKTTEINLDKGGRHMEVEGKENRSVFVSNLDFAVTELEVKDALSSVGHCEVLLVRDFKGRSKGFGYVLFEKPEMVEEALKKDRESVNNRPMFVSKCQPDKQSRSSGLRFPTELEKNKLFVKGLPFTCTKTDIENIFKPYGALKDVRVVTFRNGHSKGLAYVDFEDEVSAAQALLKTDNTIIKDRTISVALSRPPERRDPSEIKSYPPVAKFKSQASPLLLGRRAKLSFTPSVLQKKSAQTASTSADDKTPLNNDDFRKMLLGSK
ncbi:squamous cell carcinoma antigen recognized by T-cells 3 isoform X2 [Acyrthosiphon pisum]|uniref:RRM domain-containing protein n=1 Tax=Acyrthosiphon pisum TaxID=7029 RepID=A0A8R1W5D8_ACYPI|nr:squamous cell carcinoma antigen recognized by T-cells 3 isoform X2 [Acyrthosiphon pisum]|eukprot:XP_001946245.2 PREDICTED: squamous cell carcinoma antigen recognized by T-cells 3 isoform X2 [Acyrthosiphon pisum]